MSQATRAAPAAVVAPVLYRFSVAQYQQLQREGQFGSERVELLDGLIVRKGPMNPPHAVSHERVLDELRARLPAGWCLRSEKDIVLSASQPQPDVVLAVGSRDDYATRHPGPRDIVLVVEVADTTLDDDRTTKLRLYARDRIPVYWIVNLPERQLEVYTQPVAGKDPRYRSRMCLPSSEAVTVAIGTHLVGPISVVDLLPPV